MKQFYLQAWAKNLPGNACSALCTFLNAVYPLSKEAMEVIDRETKLTQVKKGQFLIEPGSPNENLFFIVKGVVRGYMIEEKKEITTWINAENEIVGAIRNLGLDLPSEEYVQVIEDSIVVYLPHSLLDYLYEHFPEGNIIGRKLLEDNYRGSEERAYICRIPSAEKKYKRFVATQPDLLNRIPLKYIASYLGMTVETMSRIRGRR